MHTWESLMKQLEELGIDGKGTLLVHSSMKSMGPVEGGADTVLDALTAYMKEGLLVLPTHTWSYINADNPRFYVDQSPSCVGILPELFANVRMWCVRFTPRIPWRHWARMPSRSQTTTIVSTRHALEDPLGASCLTARRRFC